jgi:hypothetical protein
MKKVTFGLLLLAALALAALALPAQAQKRGGPPQPTPEELEQKREAAKIDKQYKDALKRAGSDAPTRVDPWANLRGNDNAKR